MNPFTVPRSLRYHHRHRRSVIFMPCGLWLLLLPFIALFWIVAAELWFLAYFGWVVIRLLGLLVLAMALAVIALVKALNRMRERHYA